MGIAEAMMSTLGGPVILTCFNREECSTFHFLVANRMVDNSVELIITEAHVAFGLRSRGLRAESRGMATQVAYLLLFMVI
jgi:hypothetical protein